MFFAKIPRHIRQNAITEGDLECILTRNCEGTEQLRYFVSKHVFHYIMGKWDAQGEKCPKMSYYHKKWKAV